MEQKALKQLKKDYESIRRGTKTRLSQFKRLQENEKQKEFMFCLLTPQSNAQRCWEAVEQISKLDRFTDDKIKKVLKAKTRFHNNKTKYILEAKEMWNKLIPRLQEKNVKELRNWLAENVKGYGLKESSHFLRNIGKSNNQIAILDRHILKNLQKYGIIQETKIKSKKDYLEKEAKFLEFAKSIDIPADELDLLFWSRESGKLFK